MSSARLMPTLFAATFGVALCVGAVGLRAEQRKRQPFRAGFLERGWRARRRDTLSRVDIIQRAFQQPAQAGITSAQPSPQLPTQFATSGSIGVNSALAPGSSLGSPSESRPSSPGGGGKSLEDCMGFWDATTHMSKSEWRVTCLRTMKNF
jgi:hypothetical protein